MTTLRVTRHARSGRDAADVMPAPPPVVPESADADALRLALIDPPAARTTLDGAWWPRTRDLAQELPPLVEELHRRGIRATRVAYNPDAWEATTRRLPADGRTIRLGWFRGIDPHLLNLTGDWARGRVDLLVVPPDTTAAVAHRAFSAATDRANASTPSALLGALSPAGHPEAGRAAR
jgi:hypothetical protein